MIMKFRPERADWRLWRTVECRTAGFPAELVSRLADDTCAIAADRTLAAAAHETSLWNESRANIESRIRKLVQRMPAAAAHQNAGGGVDVGDECELPRLRAAAKAVDKRRLDEALSDVLPRASMQALARAGAHARDMQADFHATFGTAVATVGKHLRDVVLQPRFREAVAWQNKRVLTEVMDRLATRSSGSARRRAEDLVAGYLQRYCVKNDTIGFFGPVGWATWDDDNGAPAVALRTASTGMSARHVYFEDWAIQALADRLSADVRLMPWLVPTPYARLEGQVLHLPGGARVQLSREEAVVYRACNGALTVRRVAEVILANPFTPLDDEAQVIGVLAALADARRVQLGFGVRLSDLWPERHLRTQLEAIDDPGLRLEALAPLQQLELGKVQVAAAAGLPDALLQALQRLDEAFELATASPASRSAGQTYGARTVVYEDCRRAAEVSLGPPLRAALQPALDLVLSSSRWFCQQVAAEFRMVLRQIFDSVAGTTGAQGSRSIDLATFWLHAHPCFYGDGPVGVAAVRAELLRRWNTLLQPGDGTQDVLLRSQELAAAGRDAFATFGTGWPQSVHHSPDVMSAARDMDAIGRGDCMFVLGEVHAGINTLINHSAVQQHTRPQSLLDALHADLGTPRIVPLVSRVGSGQPIRVQTVTDVRCDIELRCSLDALPLQRATALSAAELWVHEADVGLVVRSVDGQYCVDLMSVFGQLLSGFVADKFQILSAESRSPRVTIDRLVVQRRAWRVPLPELPFVDEQDAAHVFLQMRRWAAERGLPRRCFVELRWESKPFYLDLASPLYVRMLAKQLRSALRREADADADADSLVVFSEMLPSHDELWMPLEGDRRCTSELRLVAVHEDDRP